jgi:ribonuclease HII
MPPTPLIEHVNDSKKVSETRREALYPVLTETALGYALGWVWPETIDEINILQATRQAFALAFSGMPIAVTDVLVDAMRDLDIPARQHPMIHGDALSYNIACASIIAKVARDRYMIEQDAIYPQYGFAKHKGYGTAEHIAAIKRYGPCPIHRRSFIGKFI